MERQRRAFTSAWWHGAIFHYCSGSGVCHEIPKGDGMHSYGLFKESVEKHSPGSRPSAVKSEGKFVQVGLYMVRTERALVGAEQPPFHERRHAVYSRESFVGVHTRALDRCASMNIVIPCRQRVGSQSVGKNRRARFNMSQQKGSQGVGLSVGYHLNAAAAESFWLDLFHRHRNEDFASCPSSALPGVNSANNRFIHFHIAGKPRVFGVPNSAAKSVQHCPSGLVGAKPQQAMERFGRDAVLRCRHMPGRSKPHGERRFRVMKDRARRCRNPAPARFTPPPTVFHAPPRAARTFRAGKTGWPAQPVQVIKAGSIIRKPAEKIGVILGIVFARLRPGLQCCICHPCILTLPHLSGYPV